MRIITQRVFVIAAHHKNMPSDVWDLVAADFSNMRKEINEASALTLVDGPLTFSTIEYAESMVSKLAKQCPNHVFQILVQPINPVSELSYLS